MPGKTTKNSVKKGSGGDGFFTKSRISSEVQWLVLLGLCLWLILIMATYHREDPGWSRIGMGGEIFNRGGPIGAWMADMLFFLFGFSAWWWVVWCVVLMIRVAARYRQDEIAILLNSAPGNRLWHYRPRWCLHLGFGLLLLCSTALEALRFYRWSGAIFLQAGGALGYTLSTLSLNYIGFTGGTLVLLCSMLIAWTLFTGMSWIILVERVGATIYYLGIKSVTAWEIWQDRRQGSRSQSLREREVKEGREERYAQRLASQGSAEGGRVNLGMGKGAPAKEHPRKEKEAQVEGDLLATAIPPNANIVSAPASPVVADGLDEREQESSDIIIQPSIVDLPLPLEDAPPVRSNAVPEPQMSEDSVLDSAELVHIPPPPPPPPLSARARAEEDESQYGKQLTLLHSEEDKEYVLPPLALLDHVDHHRETISREVVEFNSRLIEKKLKDFGIQVIVHTAYPGPVITRYEIEPASGVKGSQIVGLARDLARALSLVSIRVVETIPGKNLMGLELPNPRRQTVRLSEIVSTSLFDDPKHNPRSTLLMALGKDIAGHPVVADLTRMPHLLVAGATGAGKSVGVNAMLLSLLYRASPDYLRLLLIDPKMLEMSVYADIPHLLAPVVTDMSKAAAALSWCVAEMDRRYRLMSAMGVRNLAGFNTKIQEAIDQGTPLLHPFSVDSEQTETLSILPMIVVVIDELADLMMTGGKKIEELIARLTQKARAAGIHLILATQRPSVDVITGLIKANVPTRIAFQVATKIDSRTILDQMGAESLLGQGDMLYLPPGQGVPMRVHGAFVADAEVHRVVEHLRQAGQANYVEGVLDPPSEETSTSRGKGAEGGEGGSDHSLYDQAVAVVLDNRRATISLVQRRLRIGYNRAANLLEDMEKAGVVGPMQANGSRAILVPSHGD